MTRRLPPLTALRAFEAAARHLSFTSAAAELFVTQAAVSRQVRELEEWLGVSLFHRLHRRVELTEPGQRLADHLTGSFDALARVVRTIRDPQTERLVVSVEPGLAARWLVPRLGAFHAVCPTAQVVLDSSPALVRVGVEADLAIRWSLEREDWSGTRAVRLLDAIAFPVAAPAALAAGPPLRVPGDLLGWTLLYEDYRNFWLDWFAAAGLAGVETPRGPTFSDLALALNAASLGQGIALADLPLVVDDLAAGRLVRPFPHTIALGSYWLLSPPDGPGSPAARVFADWVRAEMALIALPD